METTTTLTDFLLSRIAENEQDAIDAMNTSAIQGESVSLLTTLVLGDCQAKRRIVEEHPRRPLSEEIGPEWEDQCETCVDSHEPQDWPCRTMSALAAVYADHPDYRTDW